MKGAATITATYRRHGRAWQVLIRPKNAARLTRVVPAEPDAIALVHHFNRLGMAGVDLGAALAEARAEGQRVYAPLRDVLPPFLDEQVTLGNIRASTAAAYRGVLRRWIGCGPRQPTERVRLGDTPWNLITREEIGAVLLEIRKAGKSFTVVQQLRCPLTKFYQWQMHVRRWPGPNPAADLKLFIGRRPTRKRGDYQWFRQEEIPQLLAACRAAYPRWYAFLLVAFAAGTRWGETAALERSAIDWARGRLHIRRTWSEHGGKIERCKDGDDRWVKLTAAAALQALQAHLESLDLEAQVKGWGVESRQLAFPNTRGRISRYGSWLAKVWQPLIRLAKLPYRSPHAMRHSYATWMLEDGADLRYVKDQLGHASIEETEGTYGHLERRRHEARVDLNPYLDVTGRQSASTRPAGGQQGWADPRPAGGENGEL